MMLTRSLSLLCLAVSAWALTPRLSPHVRHESRRALPYAWAPVNRANPDMVVPLRIGLVQPNIDQLESMLMDVSHPDSPNYGNHWSPEKVAETFRASQESVDTVTEWLVAEGIDPSRVALSRGGNWIETDVTIAEAEGLLKTEYHVYIHETTGAKHIACNEAYHVPEHVSKHVELITPTLHFDVKLKRDRAAISKRAMHSTAVTTGKISGILNQLENCDQQITPDCLRALYNFVDLPVFTSKEALGIVEYTPVSYLPGDLDMFFGNFSPSQVGQRPILNSIDGGELQTFDEEFGTNGEADLDLQYAMSLVGKEQVVQLYQVGDFVEGASFNNLLDALDGTFCTFEGGDDPNVDGIYPDPFNQTGAFEGPETCGTIKAASVISTSFGFNEADLTPFYTARQCNEYAKLGLMGITFLYSSGDDGVAGFDDVCLLPNGTESLEGKIFNPSFPGGCPFITSVGATQVTDPESACMQVIFSGGGFSNHFRMPDYQKAAVEGFLKDFPPPFPPTIFNTTGSRAFPDIAANGANYVVAVDGEFELVFGTSCSSPVSASILSAVNNARLAVGKKPIGFINPTIYSDSFKGIFNDITNGTNPGCGTEGFSAVPGWDPVTGLGTPNFPKLVAKFLTLP